MSNIEPLRLEQEPTDADGHSDLAVVTSRALSWARERDYAGWDPYDGLNSPILSAVGQHYLARLFGIHLVNRAPVNVRPLLGIERERNPMGVALFARTNLFLGEASGDDDYVSEAASLLEWLLTKRSPSHENSAWGYNFDWQNARKFFLRAYEPCTVVSVICGEAFLHHYRVTGERRSLAVAREVAEFLTTDINVVEAAGHDVYSYTTDDEFVVVNANALVARYLAQVSVGAGAPQFRHRASELVEFVLDVQTGEGGWYYSVPREESNLTCDNFHTGYVVESLRTYAGAVGDAPRVERAYDRGACFYRRHLFEDDGAPRFEVDSPYPRGAHGAAQGIRTFAYDGRGPSLREARSVLEWTLEHLYDSGGYFYRHVGRFLADTTPYIRWSQAWMCFALASLLYYAEGGREAPEIAP